MSRWRGGPDLSNVEQTLAPEEQMWLDLGQLIRDQVPGKDGKTIPPEVTSGVYQIKDLSHVVLGPLYEAKLIVDKTNGHAFYGCYQCCGDDGAVMGVVPIDVFVNGTLGQTVWSASHCDGGPYNINSAMTSWWTNDATIATASNAQVHGVALGSTDNLAEGEISTSGFRQCGQMQGRPSGPTNVGQQVSLVQTDCSTQPNASWSAGWGNPNNLNQCALSEPGPALPAGGACVNNGKLPDGSAKICYQINQNNCQETFCPGATRIVNSICSQFLDEFPVVTVTIPAGCSP
jgi:hypothetical protein